MQYLHIGGRTVFIFIYSRAIRVRVEIIFVQTIPAAICEYHPKSKILWTIAYYFFIRYIIIRPYVMSYDILHIKRVFESCLDRSQAFELVYKSPRVVPNGTKYTIKKGREKTNGKSRERNVVEADGINRFCVLY